MVRELGGGEELALSVSGWVSWAAPQSITSANVQVTASVVKAE